MMLDVLHSTGGAATKRRMQGDEKNEANVRLAAEPRLEVDLEVDLVIREQKVRLKGPVRHVVVEMALPGHAIRPGPSANQSD